MDYGAQRQKTIYLKMEREWNRGIAKMSKQLSGIPVSDGYAVCKVIKYIPQEIIVEQLNGADPEVEFKRFEDATEVSFEQIRSIMEKTKAEIDEEHSKIFEAHLEILRDPELVGAVKSKIDEEKVNADYALQEVINMFVSMFAGIDNEYIRERAADIQDVGKRLILNIQGKVSRDISNLTEDAILIAKDLTPSDTALMDKKHIKAFVTEVGGRTSHSAIMARSLEIPAIVGVTGILQSINDGDELAMNACSGEVFLNPNDAVKRVIVDQQAEFIKMKDVYREMVNQASITKDGLTVEIVANIGSKKDLDQVINNGAEGIGLFRTEFLYMNSDSLPTEDAQFDVYKSVLETMKGKPVVIRTLDIGGDKELSYMEMDKEMNPFLGVRALRLCIEKKDIFVTQLRALLRASVYGNLKIMFPMIATIGEWRRAKAILDEVHETLVSEGFAVSEEYEVGMMVEIPTAAILADRFAKEVDFFSIGTNDLIQYSFAADRMNEKLAYLYQPFNPAILILVNMVIKAAHANGKWVGMCGEMAGEPLLLPVLLGLGLDEFSMSASSIPRARYLLNNLNKEDTLAIVNQVLLMESNDEVLEYLKER